jgi:hypothetical protein
MFNEVTNAVYKKELTGERASMYIFESIPV